MKKKLNLIAAAIIFILALGVFFLQRADNSPNNFQAQEEAIKQAQQYQPEGICTQVITPAVHKATGARYTFNTGCLPPGWEVDYQTTR